MISTCLKLPCSLIPQVSMLSIYLKLPCFLCTSSLHALYIPQVAMLSIGVEDLESGSAHGSPPSGHGLHALPKGPSSMMSVFNLRGANGHNRQSQASMIGAEFGRSSLLQPGKLGGLYSGPAGTDNMTPATLSLPVTTILHLLTCYISKL
jgi:hypothetical protein